MDKNDSTPVPGIDEDILDTDIFGIEDAEGLDDDQLDEETMYNINDEKGGNAIEEYDGEDHEFEIIDQLESEEEEGELTEKTTGRSKRSSFAREGDGGYTDSSSGEEQLDDSELHAMLEKGIDQESLKKNDNAPIITQKTVLKELEKDPFDILPEGWVAVTHNCGMPIYLHKDSRVCTMAKPYSLGTASTRSHSIPISAIPCLQYRRQLDRLPPEDKVSENKPDSTQSDSTTHQGAQVPSNTKGDETTSPSSTLIAAKERKLSLIAEESSNRARNDSSKTQKEELHTGREQAKPGEKTMDTVAPCVKDVVNSEAEGTGNIMVNTQEAHADEGSKGVCESGVEGRVMLVTSGDRGAGGPVSGQQMKQADISGVEQNLDVKVRCPFSSAGSEVSRKEDGIAETSHSADEVNLKTCISSESMTSLQRKEDGIGDSKKGPSGKKPVNNVTPAKEDGELEEIDPAGDHSPREEAGKSATPDEPEDGEILSDDDSTAKAKQSSSSASSSTPAVVVVGCDAPLRDKQTSSVSSTAEPSVVKEKKVEVSVEPACAEQAAPESGVEEQQQNGTAETSELVTSSSNSLATIKRKIESLRNKRNSKYRKLDESGGRTSASAASWPQDRKTGKMTVDYTTPVSAESQADMEETLKATAAQVKVQTAEERAKNNYLEITDVTDYCSKLFRFKVVEVKKFKSWKERRKFMLAQKKSNRPELPSNTKLITCSIPQKDQPGPMGAAGLQKGKREFVLNPSGKSYLSILHEYMQRTLKLSPTYVFKEIENSKTPYSATVTINNLEYGTGYASSKKNAKQEAAKETLRVLIPDLFNKVSEQYLKGNTQDVSFFDNVKVTDPRVNELSQRVGQPTPFAILQECLRRNFGLGDTGIEMKAQTVKHQKCEFSMKVGKHSTTLIAKNKRDGKQMASQAILEKLHPHIPSWGSLLRLYGTSVEKQIQKPEEVSEVKSEGPNHSVLASLREEMRKLHERKEAIQVKGKMFISSKDLPNKTIGMDL